MPNRAQTVTPDLTRLNNENDPSDSRMILPYLLRPKIEYSTEFLFVTKTKDIHDFSHTATVLAVNCVPEEAKHLPLCPSGEASLVSNPVEKYHSNLIQMIKAQDQIVSTLSKDDLSYLSTKILPPYYEVTENKDVAMNEKILSNGLQRIRQMIFQYVMNKWAHRHLEESFVEAKNYSKS